MKFYTATVGPNPQALSTILKYKNMEDIPQQEVDMLAAENRSEAYLQHNPLGQLPALELDNGIVISEISAIAEYLEELRPDPVLCGRTAEERAITRMWMRRADYLLFVPMMLHFRHGAGAKFFEKRIRIEEDVSAPIGRIAHDGLLWFDARLADGRTYICGTYFTYVDIVLAIFLGFFIGQSKAGLPRECVHLATYLERLKSEPCLAA